MKRTKLCVLLLLSLVLMFSCGKESKSPTGPPLEDTYTISGTVTGADSVTVTLSGDASATWMVKKSGESYSFTVPSGASYTITPSKSGYAFTPSNMTIKKLTANQTQNFEAKVASYTISGTVTGADSVTVTLSGDSSATWMVEKSGGTYSFTVAAFGTYTITPTKKGYVFTPPNKTFENLVATYVQSFTAIPLFTLSGTITGADGVTVTLSGDASDTQTVNSGGTYSFIVPGGGTYTITPSTQWHSFIPANKIYENLSCNQTQDFDAKRDTYTISGMVTDADSVMVALSGDASEVQTVNNGGRYSFSVKGGGNYTVTPSKTGYLFAPASWNFTNVTENKIQDLTAMILNFVMQSIPAGSFQMGQTGIAEPVHRVTLSGFEMSVYETTQGQYKAVMGTNPSDFTGDDNLPVEEVSWWDAIKYCNALSRKWGLTECYNEITGACDFNKNGFRLPTEAEWEYACRAGTTTAYYTGDTENDLAKAGWYRGNSGDKTHPVGQKTPNTWGLYDMHGNVGELCYDWYARYSSGSVTNPTGALSGNNRVSRGGSWVRDAISCGAANPATLLPELGSPEVGYRVVRRP